jgi:FAD/FMN-containing dehydrogenase/Fe-S oxidoreductase
LRKFTDSEIRFDNGTKALYATDGSNYRYVPIGVVIPKNKQAVIDTVKICRKYELPLLARGGGTALAGQCCNEAIIIDFSKYLNSILEINSNAKTATVQPGTILDDLRKKAQKEFNLTFGPDPATHNHCTFGGMIGNNSCGIHSVMAGRTSDNVDELEILTYTGLHLHVGPRSDKELSEIIARGDSTSQIYSNLVTIRNQYSRLIKLKYPRIPRRVSGYNLDELLPENNFNVARALVGTENTCVIILEAKVRLVYSPPGRALLVLGYPSVFDAAQHINDILDYHPVGLEGVDDLLIRYMQKKNLHIENINYLPDGKGWLLVEFGGEDRKDAINNALKLIDHLKREPLAPTMKLYTDLQEEGRIWDIRESGLGATANVPGMPLAWPGWEDSAVNPDYLSNYLHELRSLFHKYNYDAALYGHFGQACVHCRITFDLVSKKGIQAYRSFIDDASDLVLKYDGSFSGEHGDGQSRAALLPKMFGPELVEAFDKFKAVWDPQWKMNPGKIVKPNDITAGLRLGANYNPWAPETHYKFTEDNGSIAKATLRCVGVGKCRRTENVFMCPSFLVTRDEEHTTRGRAHALFEMFQRDIIGHNGWKTEEVLNSLDLCLSCKGCKKECPVNVDMATYKSEFLSHYYKFPKIRPRHAYIMGLIGYIAPIGSKYYWFANFLTQTPFLKNIVKAISGITQKRPFPKIARQSFTSWYRYRSLNQIKTNKQVMLFPDIFNNYFFPHSLKAAFKVLEKWGYTVSIPSGFTPGIRPLIHYGMLSLAKWELYRLLNKLKDKIRDGIPIVVLEPSTAAVFRDEMLQLLPHNQDAMRMAEITFLFSEFIEHEKIDLPKISRQAILHGHCHEKAVLNMNAIRSVLKQMDINFTEPQEGCCGMAGSFGFEAKHYELSQKIGHINLIPSINKSDSRTLIIADGFSCRTQILDGTGKMGEHLAEVIADAYGFSYKD